jgi:hypothetical protein
MNSTSVKAKEYATNKWDWELIIESDKVKARIENGEDIVGSFAAVKAQVLAVLTALHNLDSSIVMKPMVTITPLPVSEPLE